MTCGFNPLPPHSVKLKSTLFSCYMRLTRILDYLHKKKRSTTLSGVPNKESRSSFKVGLSFELSGLPRVPFPDGTKAMN